jgi:hypothetical protein
MYKVIEETKSKVIIEVPAKYKNWVFERLIPEIKLTQKQIASLKKKIAKAKKSGFVSESEVMKRYGIRNSL